MPFDTAGPNKARQASSHPHQTIFNTMNPVEEELLIPDLGADKVWRLKRRNSTARWALHGSVQCEVGGGPRHVVTHGASPSSQLICQCRSYGCPNRKDDVHSPRAFIEALCA